jgi:hypothetical protein
MQSKTQRTLTAILSSISYICPATREEITEYDIDNYTTTYIIGSDCGEECDEAIVIVNCTSCGEEHQIDLGSYVRIRS